jgi:hypothetical protein
MIWERTNSPLALLGSIVPRKCEAATISDVIWQMTTEAWVRGWCVKFEGIAA